MVAYAIDRAVWTFGAAVEADMDAAEQRVSRGKAKPNATVIAKARQKVLDDYTKTGKPREVTEKGRYRDPASMASRRRKG